VQVQTPPSPTPCVHPQRPAACLPARFSLASAVGPSVSPLTFVIPVRSQPAAISRPATAGVSPDNKLSSSTTFPTEAVPSSFALRRTARHWQLPAAVRARHLLNAANRSLPADYFDVTNQLSPPTPSHPKRRAARPAPSFGSRSIRSLPNALPPLLPRLLPCLPSSIEAVGPPNQRRQVS
jgi:hypothetical protein